MNKKNNKIFNIGYNYLLSFPKINKKILENHLNLYKKNKIITKNDLFFKMITHAQNRQGMPNSIGNINSLKQILLNFNPEKVLKKYITWENLFDTILTSNYQPPGRMQKNNPHNFWVIYCKSILSICNYINKFKSIKDFKNYVGDFITSNPDTRLAFPLILKEEIFGFKFALACDFVKEYISPEFIKPDTHIKKIFVLLGISKANSTDFEIYRDVIKYSQSINKLPYIVDKLFWLIGSGKFYLNDIKIKTNINEFYKLLK